MEMVGMPSRTILRMAIHMDTRMDPSTPRRTGRSIFGVDGVVTIIGTVTSTGMAADTADMKVAGMVVADTGEVTKSNRDKHRCSCFPRRPERLVRVRWPRQWFSALPLNVRSAASLFTSPWMLLSALLATHVPSGGDVTSVAVADPDDEPRRVDGNDCAHWLACA
jgi:hypothetical protein